MNCSGNYEVMERNDAADSKVIFIQNQHVFKKNKGGQYMKKLFLLLIVGCLLISSVCQVYARDIHDAGAVNIVQNQTSQFYENRHNSDVYVPEWLNTSKGEYFMLDTMIQKDDLLTSFDQIIGVTVTPSLFPELSFSLQEFSRCDYFLGNNWKEFYLLFRYEPWMQKSDWTYTLKYTAGKRGDHHVQTFTRPGAVNSETIPNIQSVWFSPDGNTAYWYGLGISQFPGQNGYRMRMYDEYGCIIDQSNNDPNDLNHPIYFDSTQGANVLSVNVSDLRGKMVRVENRRNVDAGYGITTGTWLTARSVYIFKVPE